MSDAQKQVERERMRLATVRLCATTALDLPAATRAQLSPLYVACSEYLRPAMWRLIRQDEQFLSLVLRRSVEKTGRLDEQVIDICDEVDRKLKQAARRAGQVETATALLQKHGDELLPDFEPVLKGFVDFIVKEMGHHAPSVNLAVKYYEPADWTTVMTPDTSALEDEQARFEAVFAAVPPGIDEISRETLERAIAERFAARVKREQAQK